MRLLTSYTLVKSYARKCVNLAATGPKIVFVTCLSSCIWCSSVTSMMTSTRSVQLTKCGDLQACYSSRLVWVFAALAQRPMSSAHLGQCEPVLVDQRRATGFESNKCDLSTCTVSRVYLTVLCVIAVRATRILVRRCRLLHISSSSWINGGTDTSLSLLSSTSDSTRYTPSSAPVSSIATQWLSPRTWFVCLVQWPWWLGNMTVYSGSNRRLGLGLGHSTHNCEYASCSAASLSQNPSQWRRGA